MVCYLRRARVGGSLVIAWAALACGGVESSELEESTNSSIEEGVDAASAETFGVNERFEVGTTTFCVVDPTRGFDEPAGVTDGQRLLIVQAWYPVERSYANNKKAVRTTFGDYFKRDADLLVRTERALLTTSGFSQAVIDANIPSVALAQFDVPRGSFLDAPVARRLLPFPIVLYSHGTLQHRFTNDSAAENLARNGYIVVAPEHTGNSALAPLGKFCPNELARPGVKPAGFDSNPRFNAATGEYIGVTHDPFFIVGNPVPSTGTINPAEVALTMARVGDYRATILATRIRFLNLLGPVGLIGYSRGAMHGIVGQEILPEISSSVQYVGGTPLKFYVRDVQAAPINEALSRSTGGRRTVLDRVTEPTLEIIGGEDTRRKASTDVAAQIGVYPFPSATTPSPIVSDSFSTMGRTFGMIVRVEDVDHFDFVDDPFVIAYRAQGGVTRTGAFDPNKRYVSRPVTQRQAIRDGYTKAMFDYTLKGRLDCNALLGNPFASQAVSTQVNAAPRCR